MKLSYEDHDSITVLTISGDLTVDQVDGFRRMVQDRFGGGVCSIVLNLEHLTQIDSAGLELMLWLIDETADRGGHLKLVKPDPTIREIFCITRLDRRFDIKDTIEAAAKSLR